MRIPVRIPHPAPGTILGALALVVAAFGSFAALTGDGRTTTAAPNRGTVIPIKNLRYVEKEHVLAAGGVKIYVTECPPNHRVISGGYFANRPFLTFPHNYPNKARDAWVVAVANPVGLPQTESNVSVFAICARKGAPVVP